MAVLNAFSDESRVARTAGEKQFDWLVYGGIGYAANVGLSIGAIWLADRTRGGSRLIDRIARPLSKASGASFDTVRSQVRYTTLLSGGFSVLAPIKWLEDNKVEWVRAYDEAHYDYSPETQAYLDKAHRRLAQEPKQTWPSILSSRLLAMVPFYTLTGLGMKEHQWLARQTNGQIFGERIITRMARGIDGALHHGNAAAQKELASKAAQFPNHTVNSFQTGVFERPVTAFADYTITEATTSSIVAGFLYGFTRLTAPFLGKTDDEALRHFSPVQPLPQALHAVDDTYHGVTQTPDASIDGTTIELAASNRLKEPTVSAAVVRL